MEGVMLLGVYRFLAIAFYFIPAEPNYSFEL